MFLFFFPRIRSRFRLSLLPFEARSLAARALSQPQQQQQQPFVAASASSSECFECRRHGLLVVLLVLCDTYSVAAMLLVL